MKIGVRGVLCEVTKEKIIAQMKKTQPKYDIRQKYWVDIDNLEYPLKQVIGTVFGLDPVDFTTGEAYRVLKKLGFRILKKWI